MKKMIVSGWEEEKKKRKKEEEEEERVDNFKIRFKTRRKEKNYDDKNMVQIHDEQRSIQMTMLHRDIQIYTYTQKHCLDKHCDYK